MKLHFDPNQQFQHDAINAIVRVISGIVPARNAAKVNPVDALRFEQ